jgi:histidine ammonia-lyase
MGAAAARHARTVLGHVEQIVAIELLCAAQALELRLGMLTGPGDGGAGFGAGATIDAGAEPAPGPGEGVAEALRRIREHVRSLGEDREPGPDLAAMATLVHEGALADLASPA